MPRARYWREKTINAERQRIKAEIDSAGGDAGGTPDAPARLRYILARVGDLEEDLSDSGLLRRYIYCISALVQHERGGGLSGSQVRGLAGIAQTIIRLFRIRPGFSKAGRLYSDLHLVLSQLERKSGAHWLAAWEQQLAMFFARANPIGGKGFQALAYATRALRLGHASTALEALQVAEAQIADESRWPRVWFERIRILRLQQRYGQADQLAARVSEASGVTSSLALEFQWEALLRHVQEKGGDLDGLQSAISRGGSHYRAGYVAEYTLWARAVASRRWMERLKPLPQRRRDDPLGLRQLGAVYDAAQTLERCYDVSIPLSHRLEGLGELLARSDQVLVIDRLLLIWLAAARWLARIKSLPLANLALCEYTSLSMKLTNGSSPDALGLATDLIERPWYLGVGRPNLGPASC